MTDHEAERIQLAEAMGNKLLRFESYYKHSFLYLGAESSEENVRVCVSGDIYRADLRRDMTLAQLINEGSCRVEVDGQVVLDEDYY